MADTEQVKSNFWDSLAKLLDDLTSLEVATYVTYDGMQSPVTIDVKAIKTPALLQAYTKFDLDADTTALLPVKKTGDELEIRDAVLRVHETHVKTALETRAKFIEALLKAIPDVLQLG
jgi:hypothetical protein